MLRLPSLRSFSNINCQYQHPLKCLSKQYSVGFVEEYRCRVRHAWGCHSSQLRYFHMDSRCLQRHYCLPRFHAHQMKGTHPYTCSALWSASSVPRATRFLEQSRRFAASYSLSKRWYHGDPDRVINGKHVAASIKQRLREEIPKWERVYHSKPGLALIQVGNRQDSTKYVTAKKATAEEIGMNSLIYNFDEDASDADVLKTIEDLNADMNVHGIVVQLPLPSSMSKQLILDAIHPLKDVDGFQTRNSATALAVMDLLDYKNVVIEGSSAVIIGRSLLVGKPIADRLLERNATISICHSHTPLTQIKKLTQTADIIVSACGVPRIIKKDFLKPGCVVIDVGISREGKKIVGDADFEECKHVARAITPVPGGVGPMTVSKLMDATMTAFKRINNIPLEEDEMIMSPNIESGLNKEALDNHLQAHEKLWALSQ